VLQQQQEMITQQLRMHQPLIQVCLWLWNSKMLDLD
jgi:hypothetical protein